MIERNIQARLIYEQNKIINLYSRHNKSCTVSIIPMEIDDGNATFNSLHYNDIIITAIERSDIVVKVFHQKVQEFKVLVIKRGVLRKCIAYT